MHGLHGLEQEERGNQGNTSCLRGRRQKDSPERGSDSKGGRILMSRIVPTAEVRQATKQPRTVGTEKCSSNLELKKVFLQLDQVWTESETQAEMDG